MSKVTLFVTTLLFSALVMSQTAFAQWWFDDELAIDFQRVDVTIQDQIATTHLDMQFRSIYGTLIEGQYLFPIPEDATITDLILYINGEPIRGEVLGAVEAGEIYQDYVNQLIDPALLEYIAPGLVQVNVFPITDTRRIELEYQQVLLADEGVIEYVFPQNSEYSSKEITIQTINATVDSNEEIVSLTSESHPIDGGLNTPTTAFVSYEEANILPNLDFNLTYTVTQDSIGLNLLSYNPVPTETGAFDENGYFLMLVAPTVDIPDEQIIPKDVILVFDTSGSMSGDKIDQARAALLDVVGRLNPDDRFNIIPFSSSASSYSNELVSASDPGDYESYVNNLIAAGGTNINDALLTALEQADPERLTTILFLSDGAATAGETNTPQILENIAPNVGENVRLFSFAVGVGTGGPDMQLLESIASAHNGETTVIQLAEEVETAVTSFYETISRPVLTNITIDFGGAPVQEITPAGPYDLFVGEQLVVTGRYRDEAIANGTLILPISSTFPITLTGDYLGEMQTFVYDGMLTAGGGDEVLAVEWARRTIDDLLAEIVIQHGSIPEPWEIPDYVSPAVAELADSVKNLGIQYSIVTPFTSYLVEEPDLINEDFFFNGEFLGEATAVSLTTYELSTSQIPLFLFVLLCGMMCFVVTVQRIVERK